MKKKLKKYEEKKTKNVDNAKQIENECQLE